MISMIAAIDKNFLIGSNNAMPWGKPVDGKYFREITMGKPIVMGRKTFESLGKALPGRTNVVLTSDMGFAKEACVIVHSVEEVLKLGAQGEIVIIGGAKVYEAFLPHADVLYLTEIEAEFEGDTYFPAINVQQWKVEKEERREANEKIPYVLTFKKYLRA
ncbi:MAG TPA: dihydrofolate reductase [Candidatus Paceibacterota bacterium]